MPTVDNTLSLVKHATFAGVSAVAGRHIDAAFPRHFHRSFTIGTVDRGARMFVGNHERWLVKPGRLFLLNPGEPHSCPAHGDGHDYRVVNIDAAVMRSMALEMDRHAGSASSFGRIMVEDAVALESFNAVFERFAGGAEPDRLRGSFLALLACLPVDHDGAIHPTDYPVRRHTIDAACRYIDAHFAEKISLAQLSRASNLSPFHFQKVFLRYKGISPQDYLYKARIDRAAQLLLAGWPAVDVAFETGFTDQSHFTRYFKRHTGITPAKFARQNRQLP